MKFIGYQFIKPKYEFGVGFYKVTNVETSETLHIMNDDFEAFFIDTNFVSSDAVMGGCSVPGEILYELGFKLPGIISEVSAAS